MRLLATAALAAPAIEADMELDIEEVNDGTYELIKTLEPFGQENLRPRFLIRTAKIADLRKVGSDGSHLKMKLGPQYIGAIYFRGGENGFKVGDTISMVAELQKNIWNGKRAIELRVVDARRNE